MTKIHRLAVSLSLTAVLAITWLALSPVAALAESDWGN